jgi:hypothetical protein
MGCGSGLETLEKRITVPLETQKSGSWSIALPIIPALRKYKDEQKLFSKI